MQLDAAALEAALERHPAFYGDIEVGVADVTPKEMNDGTKIFEIKDKTGRRGSKP